MPEFHYPVADQARAARGDADARYSITLRRGSLELGYYAPRGRDHQEPHTQDEVYVVVSGTGRFVNGDSETEFGPGDAMFVPAGVEHRFVDFTDDTEMWVIFYGPPGGEDG